MGWSSGVDIPGMLFRLCVRCDREESEPAMEQSIRNELPGIVKNIVSDKVLSEVIIETACGEIASIITTSSVERLGLKPGAEVFALVKATNVSVRLKE